MTEHSVMISAKMWCYKYYQHILLIVLIVVALFSLGWQIFSLFRVSQNIAKNVQVSTVSSSEEALQVKDFAQWFGVATEKKTAVKKKEFIPKTSLNLRLKGVLVEIGDRASSAVIQGTDGKDMLYAKGDKLPGGAVLERIYPSYVVISYQGTRQKVLFPEYEKSANVRQPRRYPGHQGSYSATERQNAARLLEQRLESLRERLRSQQEY